MSSNAESEKVERAVPARVVRGAPKDRGVLVHVVVLAVAAACAVGLWTRDKESKALATGDITVWGGKSGDVTRITYETKSRKIELDAKSDTAGRYFVGSVEHDAAQPPQGHHPPPAPSASASAEAKPAARVTTTFVSVSEGEKVADALAPLKALRALGKVDGDRLAEFGLKEPDGTMTIVVGGAKHELAVGSSTGGSADRYVRDASSGEVYALKGDLVRDLDAAETRMMERDLHEWKDLDLQTATLKAGDKSRELVRGAAEGKRFWADKATPATNDETIGNWMSKFERLRPSEYATALPAEKELVLRLDFGAGRPIGFVELWKSQAAPTPDEKPAGDKPAADKPKVDWFVITERTRLPARVAASAAEQVEQDLPGLLK